MIAQIVRRHGSVISSRHSLATALSNEEHEWTTTIRALLFIFIFPIFPNFHSKTILRCFNMTLIVFHTKHMQNTSKDIKNKTGMWSSLTNAGAMAACLRAVCGLHQMALWALWRLGLLRCCWTQARGPELSPEYIARHIKYMADSIWRCLEKAQPSTSSRVVFIIST